MAQPLPQLFIDLDGVLADFDAGCLRVLGVAPPKPGTQAAREQAAAMWSVLRAAPDFFGSLPLMPGAERLWLRARAHGAVALTGCPLGGWAEPQKLRWCARVLGLPETEAEAEGAGAGDGTGAGAAPQAAPEGAGAGPAPYSLDDISDAALHAAADRAESLAACIGGSAAAAGAAAAAADAEAGVASAAAAIAATSISGGAGAGAGAAGAAAAPASRSDFVVVGSSGSLRRRRVLLCRKREKAAMALRWLADNGRAGQRAVLVDDLAEQRDYWLGGGGALFVHHTSVQDSLDQLAALGFGPGADELLLAQAAESAAPGSAPGGGGGGAQ